MNLEFDIAGRFETGRRILHHAIAYLVLNNDPEAVNTGTANGGVRDFGDLVNRRPQLMEWAIGKGYDLFREGTGRLLLPGEKISWDQHLHAIGEEVTTGSEIGIWLYPKGQEPKKRSYLVGFTGLRQREYVDIPPNSVAHTEGFTVLKENTLITNFQPHFHLRGKAMQVEAILPDGTNQIVSYVGKFNFNWMTNYIYADDAADLCSGLYSIDHALFLGQHEKIAAAADVVFHGHGIDYMYQGMYLPSRYVSFGGSPTFFRRLAPYSSDIGAQFLNEIPYRLKGLDLMSLVRPEWRERLGAHMRAAAAAVIADSEDVAHCDADRWEYFQIHALARHFSWPNIGSKMVGVEQRIPSFDVDLFDFYLSLPPERRVTGAVLRQAQLLLNHALALVPTGNWGIPAAYSPAAKTGWLVGRKALRHLTGDQSFRAPQAKDRTWPDREEHLQEQLGWRKRITDALADPQLEAALPFFDWPLLRERAQQWLDKSSGGASLLVELLSLRLFLKRTA
jgi:hypothetical protein